MSDYKPTFDKRNIYNAANTVITVKGVQITGLGENMWNFEKAEAYAEDSVGAQGDICRSVINNGIHTATITVQRTSPKFNFLCSLAKETEPFEIWCVNKTLGIKEGGNALVSEKHASSLGATAEDVDFTFTVYDGETITE